MKTSIKYLVLPLGLMMSASCFADLNQLGSNIATGAAGITKWSIDLTRGAYVAVAQPGTKLIGDTLDTVTHLGH